MFNLMEKIARSHRVITIWLFETEFAIAILRATDDIPC